MNITVKHKDYNFKIKMQNRNYNILFQFYDLFSGLNSAGDMMNAFGGRRSSSANLFGLLRFGTPVLILLTLILTYAGFKKSYKEALVKA